METKLYKCRGYLFCLYELCKMTLHEIAKELEVSHGTIYKWLKRFDISIRSISEAQKGREHSEKTKLKISKTKKGKNNPMWGKHHTEESKRKISEGNRNKHRNGKWGRIVSEETKNKMRGNKNPAWKENWDELSFSRKHYRIQKMLEKEGIFRPDTCSICGKKKGKRNLDLMNINHIYKKNTLLYYYMCNDCHINKYHFLAGLDKRNRKIKPIHNLIKNLLNLKTREERKQLLKEVILNV